MVFVLNEAQVRIKCTCGHATFNVSKTASGSPSYLVEQIWYLLMKMNQTSFKTALY